MLLCPAILMIVKASTPSRPSRVNMVCRNECTTKSSGNFKSSRTLTCWWSSDVTRAGWIGTDLRDHTGWPRGKAWDRHRISGKLRSEIQVSPGFAAHFQASAPKRLSPRLAGDGEPISVPHIEAGFLRYSTLFSSGVAPQSPDRRRTSAAASPGKWSAVHRSGQSRRRLE